MQVLKSQKVLRNYQKEGVKYLRDNDGGYMAVEMRLGKTLVVIRWAKIYKPKCTWILVIAPYSAIRGWKKELRSENQRFYHLSESAIERKEGFAEVVALGKRTWFITNKEAWITIPEIYEFEWDIVIADESHFISNPQAKITKFTLKLVKHSKSRVAMTGTPWTTSQLQLFNQLHFVDPSIIPEPNYWTYRLRNCNLYGYQWVLRKKSKEWLEKRVKERCFSLKRKDVNLEGEVVESERTVKIPQSLFKAYKEFELNFWSEYNGVTLKTKWATTNFIRLRQMCSGFVFGELVSRHKYEELSYLLKTELKNEQTVIWAIYLPEIYQAVIELKRAGRKPAMIAGELPPAKRSKVISDFHKGKISDLIIQPACMKYGEDLSCADTNIYFSLPDLLTMNQSKERIFKVGKTNSLLTIYLISEFTIEEKILDGIRRGKSLHQIFHEAVRNVEIKHKK